MAEASHQPRHRCIYCSQERHRSDFNTEHVIQAAFGRWRQNLTLPGSLCAVCSKCNDWFGRNLDLAFTRDSYEGFLRIHHGAKSLAEIGNMFPERVTVQLPEDSEFGPLKVAIGPPGPSETEDLPSLRLLPQVRVRDRDGGFVTFLEDDLAELVGDDVFERSGGVAFFCSTQEEQDRLVQKLEDLGFPMTNKRPIEGLPEAAVGEVTLMIGAVFDATIARAIAKISFNYLAYSLGPGYARYRDFDSIRRFIRYGEGEWRDLVASTDEPILAEDTRRVRTTRGHLLTLSNGGGMAGPIVGSVSLYNDMTYRVALSARTPGVARRVRKGHHYNLRTLTVKRLVDGSLLALPHRDYPTC